MNILKKYNNKDLENNRLNVLKKIVSENGAEKVIKHAYDMDDFVLLGDLLNIGSEFGSSIMTPEQVLCCYILIQDSYKFAIAKAFDLGDNISILNMMKDKV